MAFIFAIALSFAFNNVINNADYWYEVAPGNRVPIDVDCPGTLNDCKVQFINENGDPISPEYTVFPTESGGTPLKTNSLDPILIVQ
ncbi:hypothetical protein KCTC52924_02950 [Arenibacter antarcticus]